MHSFKDVSFLQFDDFILDFSWRKQSSKSILQQCHTKNTHKGEAMEGGRWTTHSIFLLNELWNEKIFSKLNLGSASIYLVNNKGCSVASYENVIKVTLKSHFQSQKLSILLLSDSQEYCPWYSDLTVFTVHLECVVKLLKFFYYIATHPLFFMPRVIKTRK